jgi:hypothetical protein
VRGVGEEERFRSLTSHGWLCSIHGTTKEHILGVSIGATWNCDHALVSWTLLDVSTKDVGLLCGTMFLVNELGDC